MTYRHWKLTLYGAAAMGVLGAALAITTRFQPGWMNGFIVGCACVTCFAAAKLERGER